MMKISIIIPVYNKEKFLSRCFDSILNQISVDDDRFEIIVVDDGSTDDSLSIINKYSDSCPLFRIIKQKNMGVSVARNIAMDVAMGEYMLFLDADDELIDQSLLKVYDYLSSSEELDMLVTLQTRKNGEVERLVDVRGLKEKQIYTGVDAYKNHYVRINAGGGICRTDFIRKYNIKFPEGVRNSEDTIFFGIVQAYANSIALYNLPLYRINEIIGSASRVDNSKIAIRYVDAVNASVKIRNGLGCSDEQKGIFEFYVFQILSNTIGYFAMSKTLGFHQLCRMIDIPDILPIKTKYMCMMRYKAYLLNMSYKAYYFISWLKKH